MRSRLSALLSLLLLTTATSFAAPIDSDLLAGMRARAVGPATMSGRIAAIDAVVSDPTTIWVGVATGGVWKSTNGGTTWAPLFDDQPVAAIGAIAVNQRNPQIVWVGTGEANPRNSASVGNGVYRSIDGGRSWTHLGLEGSERISRIILHPDDADVAWVAAMGQAWGANAERGVFKTTDGGRSWRKLLFVDDRTGAADLAIDPANPNKLFAAMWEYRRWPWFFHSGGPGSGLFVSTDGGESWKKLTEDDGLPKGTLGRIGVAVARSNSDIVYAAIETEKENVIARSADGGRNWKLVHQERSVITRPFYYADLRVDPKDANRVYNLASLVHVSDDGARTFRPLIPFRDIHPDHHAMWINPNDPRHIIEGNDGGVAISRDHGETWRFVGNLPLGQYYHVALDDETPYNIYGGMQDNGSWKGPSAVWENGGIRNHHWLEVGFGDGFATIPLPGDSTRGYAMSQEGYLIRWNCVTGERKDIRPPAPDGTELRFNWNAAIALDPFDADTVYYGSQFVHKSTNRGESWTIISPDLTTNRPEWQRQAKSGGLTPDVTGAENFTTIVAISPSSVAKEVLWVGTDDGRVHITRDGGASWTSVEANIRGVPKNSWVPAIEPSNFDPATAWVVFDNHRRSDWTPYVFRTNDYGKTWTSLVTPDLRGYALDLEQDTVDRDLLFLGTEFGLFTTLDGGKSWTAWKHGVPTVSAMALAIHPREHDLVVATHGRSAFVLDDIRPLREITPELLAKPLHLFEPPPAQQHVVKQATGERFGGHTLFRGENRPYGAMLTYSLNAADLPFHDDDRERARKESERQVQPARRTIGPEGVPVDIPAEPVETKPDPTAEEEPVTGKGPEVEIEIRDASGTLVRTMKQPARRGVNRTVWNLRRDAFRQPKREGDDEGWRERGGPELPPGEYSVLVRFRGEEARGKVNVLPDPRYHITPQARQAKWSAIVEAGRMQEAVTAAVEAIESTRASIGSVRSLLAGRSGETEEAPDPLRERLRKVEEGLNGLEREFRVPPKTKGIVDDQSASAKVRYVMRSLQSSWDEPTESQRMYLRQARQRLEESLAAFRSFYESEVKPLREAVAARKLQMIPEPPAIGLE